MKLIALVFILSLAIDIEAVEYAKQYFDINSCLLRDPVLNDLTESAEPSPFVIKASNNVYELSDNTPPAVRVSIAKNANSIDEKLMIESFILQAVIAESSNTKVVGKWIVSSTDKYAKTLDCPSEKSTLIKYGDNSIEKYEFEWQPSDIDQIENLTSVYFVATIVGSDKTYWSDVKSDKVTFIRPNEESNFELNESDEYDEDPVKLGRSISESNLNSSSKLRSKRDVTKHFEASTFQCGTRKSCYVSLKTCDVDPKTCNFVLSWDYDGELINYELTGLSYAWIGVLFTEDQYLGDDNMVLCSRSENEKLSIDHYYKKKEDNQLYKLEPEDYLKKKFISYNQNGYIYCKFSRAKTSESAYVTDLSKPHFIYVERGAPGEILVEKLGQRFQPSETKIEFANSVYVPVSTRSWLVKIHAILGIIAWIFLGSIGILLARYYKPLWPNHVLYSFRVWFSFHRSIMVFVTLLTILSFLFALIELDWGWSVDGHNLVHAILGLIVIICACINPILGFFRPTPDSKFRCLFFWFHWLIGSIAYCLAVPAIFIGMDLSKSDLPNWCAWLLFAWVIFHIIVEIILEIHYCCTFSELQGNYHEKNIDYDRINKLPVKKKNPPGYRWKPTLLFVYSIVTAIVVSALIIAIFLLDS